MFRSHIGLLVLIPALAAAVGAQAKSGPSAGVLLLDTDDSCRLTLDGKDRGLLKPDQTQTIILAPGDHIVKCTVEEVPDLVWRKIVQIKGQDQVAVLIALKALHIQYDEAAAKLKKQEGAAS